MDGWRSVSPKTSHVIAIRKIETPRMVARGAGECGDGIFLLYGIGCSFLVVLKPKALAADTIIGIRLIIWACMSRRLSVQIFNLPHRHLLPPLARRGRCCCSVDGCVWTKFAPT